MAREFLEFIDSTLYLADKITKSDTKKPTLTKNIYSFEIIYRQLDIYFYDSKFSIYIDDIKNETVKRIIIPEILENYITIKKSLYNYYDDLYNFTAINVDYFKMKDIMKLTTELLGG